VVSLLAHNSSYLIYTTVPWMELSSLTILLIKPSTHIDENRQLIIGVLTRRGKYAASAFCRVCLLTRYSD